MIWTDEAIVEWHKKTFPDLDVNSQVKKTNEEIREYIMAVVNDEGKERIREEIADVYISCLALKYRFGIDLMGCFLMDNINRERFGKDIDRKMYVNAKRKWCKINGVYRHKDIDID